MATRSPKEALQEAFQKSRLIASVQADEGTPLDDPEILLRCAQASLQNGAAALLVQRVRKIHYAGKLAMFDCDTIESIDAAIHAGADLVGTTLSGYTGGSPKQ